MCLLVFTLAVLIKAHVGGCAYFDINPLFYVAQKFEANTTAVTMNVTVSTSFIIFDRWS